MSLRYLLVLRRFGGSCGLRRRRFRFGLRRRLLRLLLTDGLDHAAALGGRSARRHVREREAGHTEEVVARQLDAVLARASFGDAVLAYEPVWAIGTGRNATPEQAQAVHAFLRRKLSAGVRILYGGSVKPQNAAAIFAMPDVDGGLIGGASLVAEDFVAILREAALKPGSVGGR